MKGRSPNHLLANECGSRRNLEEAMKTREDTILEALYRNAKQVLDLDLFSVAMLNKVSLQLDFPLVRRNTGSDSS